MARPMKSAKIKKDRRPTGTGDHEPIIVCIDHPREAEDIGPSGYVFRIGAPAETRVEVAVDGGDWLPCRAAEGYWWFDWSGYSAGNHEVFARVLRADGGSQVSEKRRFKVVA